jgi:hypothetical protein
MYIDINSIKAAIINDSSSWGLINDGKDHAYMLLIFNEPLIKSMGNRLKVALKEILLFIL